MFTRIHSTATLFLALLSITLIGIARSVTAAEGAADGEQERNAQHQEAMRAMAENVRVYDMKDGKRTELKRIEKPLYRFENESRGHNGTLWAWSQNGRPLALYELFRVGERDLWIHAFTSTSSGRLSAERKGRSRWNPLTKGIELKPFPKASSPAANPRARLGQMKMMVNRLAAHEFWIPDNTRYDLDLKAEPIHRYSDAESGLIDGAVLLFVHNTEPEIIILLEAQRSEAEKIEWRYALAIIGSAEMRVSLDGKEIWNRPRAYRTRGRPNETYYLEVDR